MRDYNALLSDYRVRQGPMASTDALGMTGAFRVPCGDQTLHVLAAGEPLLPECEGWEHVSVSLPDRCPTWEEMCYVKDLFFRSDEWVVQFHPPAAQSINHHPHCLHLWRHVHDVLPTPPPGLVGATKRGRHHA